MPRAALSQTITQKTVLSQQLRQSVELLQLSGPELQRELEVQLLSNPLLKLDEESSAAETPIKSEELPAQQAPEAGVAHDFREPNYLTWRGTAPETEDFDPYGAIGSPETLSDYLLHQLGCLRLAEDLRMRCAWIIGNLDDEGFLSDSLEELARDGAQVIGVTEDLYAWQEALRLVQGLDPAGIAADGPTQSLLIQLSRLEVSEDERTIASALLTRMPEALAKRDHKAAARALGVTVEKSSRRTRSSCRLIPIRRLPSPIRTKRAASLPKCCSSRPRAAGRPCSIRTWSPDCVLTMKRTTF